MRLTKYLPPSPQALSARWADAAILPLVLFLSVLPLFWFARNWIVTSDSSWYLLLGWNLVSGQGYTILDVPQTLRGPILPGLLGSLMLLLGRDVESLVWAARLLALANPVLMYFLVKRLAGPVSGLLAAAMLAFFGYTATVWHAFNIDAVQLTVYLLAVLTLLAAVQKDRVVLSLLSGLLLGAAILTKETSLVALPLALFAALLCRWSIRGVLLHYAGVAMVSLPWWIWVWAVSGGVYPVRRLPPGSAMLVIVALVSVALLMIISYKFGIPARLLVSERRRRWTAWSMVLVWIVPLSILLSIVGGGSDGAPGAVQQYVAERLIQSTPLWYLLPLTIGYVLWQAARGNRFSEFYLILIALQIPVSLTVLVKQLDIRQWMILQALLYGALAMLVVGVFRAVTRDERRNILRSLALRAAAVVLAVVLALSTALQVQAEENVHSRMDVTNFQYFDQANPSVLEMHDWIARNVPEGENILTTWNYSDHLIFLDDERHDWTLLEMDCEKNLRDRQRAETCPPDEEIAQAPPQPTVWFEMDEDCEAAALSMPTLMRQVEESGSEYVLISQHLYHPDTLYWTSNLLLSGAFELAYDTHPPSGTSPSQSAAAEITPEFAILSNLRSDLVLLKRTGQSPKPVPTQMNWITVERLISCEQATQGEQYVEEIRSMFPNGIEVVDSIFGSESDTSRARHEVEQIYDASP